MTRRRAALVIIFALALPGASPAALDRGGATRPTFDLPYDIAVDARGRIYIADFEARKILRYDPATRRLARYAGSGRSGRVRNGMRATGAPLGTPAGLAIGPRQELWVADLSRNRIRRIDRRGRVFTVARVRAPTDLAFDGRWRLYVSSFSNRLFRVDSRNGRVTHLAGNGRAESSGDGGPARRAAIETPHCLDADSQGNVYLDGSYRVRRIDAASGVITTVAGTGERGSNGDGGPATRAQVSETRPEVARDGTVYLAGGDPSGGRIRRLDQDGRIHAVAGNGRIGPEGEGGPATAAGFLPGGIALAPDGTLIFSQTQPRPAVRRIDAATGRVTTIVRGR